MKSNLSGGECKWGKCNCKNARGTRCGLCAQQGTLFCHLHQWCSDPANMGIEINGWIAPPPGRLYASSLYQPQILPPPSPAPPPTMLRAASQAAQSLQQPVASVIQAVSNVTDYFVPDLPPVLETEETVELVSNRGRILKPGGACDTLILRVYSKPLYSNSEVERIYNLDKRLSLYSLDDIIICLRKHKKIGNTFLKGNKVDTSTNVPAVVTGLSNVAETAARVAAAPIIAAARTLLPLSILHFSL